jgi:ABC-type uncharacterized transport system involved in gliding motility auxiliary subunit
MERKAKAATFTGIYLLVVAGILVVVNLISFTNFWRVDVTAVERHTLSKGSKRLVCEGLKQELRLDAYVTRGLAKSDSFIKDLTDLLKEYENAKYKNADGTQSPPSKFTFRLIEPKTQEEKEAAKKECSGGTCLTEQLLDEGSATGDTLTIGRGFMGFVLNYGSEKEVIPFWPPNDTQGLEFFLSNKIREVRDRADKIETKIGLISGKDEMKITDNNLYPGGQPFNLKSIFGEYFPFYTFEDVDLQNGDAEINRELRGLIITQATKDFTEKELRRIDEFLMHGDKSLVVYASAVNLKPSDATMKVSLSTHGLEKLLEGYGIEMQKSAIFDFGGGMRLQAFNPSSGQQFWIQNPAIPIINDDDSFKDTSLAGCGGEAESTMGPRQLLDTSFPPFFRQSQLAFPFASPLVLHPDKQPEAKVQPRARTYPRSAVEAGDGFGVKFSDKFIEKGPAEQRIVAATVEGTIKSAFPTGDKMGIEAPEKSKQPSRILVVSSSQFLANPFARSGNPPPMPPQLQMMGNMGGDPELQMFGRPYFENYFRPLVTSFKNTLDWIGGDVDLVAASAKLNGDPALSYATVSKPEFKENETPEEQEKKLETYRRERENLQFWVQWTLIALPALVFAALGFLRHFRREAAREKISLA